MTIGSEIVTRLSATCSRRSSIVIFGDCGTGTSAVGSSKRLQAMSIMPQSRISERMVDFIGILWSLTGRDRDRSVVILCKDSVFLRKNNYFCAELMRIVVHKLCRERYDEYIFTE